MGIQTEAKPPLFLVVEYLGTIYKTCTCIVVTKKFGTSFTVPRYANAFGDVEQTFLQLTIILTNVKVSFFDRVWFLSSFVND